MSEQKSPVDVAFDQIMRLTELEERHEPNLKRWIREVLNELHDAAEQAGWNRGVQDDTEGEGKW